MRRIILHIGPQEAGAGAIETGIGLNRTALAGEGWLVPETGFVPPAGGHALLACQLLGIPVEDRDLFAALREEVERSGLQRVIVSCEELWSVPVRLMHALRGLLPPAEVTVVACLCPQDSWLQARWPKLSAYRWQRGQERREFAEWAAGVLEPRGAAAAGVARDADYAGVLEAWASEFGRESVRVVAPADFRPGGQTFRRFLSLCGVADASRYCSPPDAASLPGPRTLAVLRHVMPEVAHRYPESSSRRVLADAVARLIVRHGAEQGWDPCAAPLADTALRERIAARFRAQNRALALRFLGRDELFDPPPPEAPAGERAAGFISGAEALALIASLLPEVSALVEAQPRAVAPWLFRASAGTEPFGGRLGGLVARLSHALGALRGR